MQSSSNRHIAACHGRQEEQQLAKACPALLTGCIGLFRAVRCRHLWACTCVTSDTAVKSIPDTVFCHLSTVWQSVSSRDAARHNSMRIVCITKDKCFGSRSDVA